MAIDLESFKTAAVGIGVAAAAVAHGLMSFGRSWFSNRAQNANDRAQIDMLSHQQQRIKDLEEDNEQKDELIRQYWQTITETQARLKIIESSQKHLEQQNESLKEQVQELTASNMNLIKEITNLRTSLEVPR